jgi:hypothetical protein
MLIDYRNCTNSIKKVKGAKRPLLFMFMKQALHSKAYLRPKQQQLYGLLVSIRP